MSYTGFVIAMAANVEFAVHSLPSRILLKTREFLIVSRWGRHGEYITVSRTGAPSNHGRNAPIGLTPRRTWLGLLLSEGRGGEGREGEARGDGESVFLLLRELPDRLVVAGSFVPAEGYARLTRDVSSLRLQAEGRDTDPLAQAHGAGVPPPGSAAMAWHVDAVRRLWIGEFIEPS